MSIFTKAKVIENPAPAKGKPDNKQKIAVEGLRKLAVVDNVVKAFTALQATLAQTCKEDITNTFIGIGKQTMRRPENFRGTDGEGVTASCELRVRGGQSPVNDEEAAILTAAGIPLKEVVIKEDAYIINPEYFNDQALLEKVSEVLSKVKGLPDNFILRQQKLVKKVADDDTVNAVFEKGLAASLLPLVATMAIKPVFEGTLDEALAEVMKLSGMAKEAEETASKKGKKK